jgi:carbamoyltransferase
MQGRAEFGPRALGSRSLLANPTDYNMWRTVNKVKGREYWRPLAPSIVEESSQDFFSNRYTNSPFMLLRFNVKDERILDIPAVVHVDNSARPQTVSRNTNELYWNLLQEFEKIQGVPLMINTSLNLRGEPIVNNVEDGVRAFFSSDIDYLCIDKYLIYR